ncbi:MAG: NifB/NifX family molybdenum-iron cluster-binding protein [Candidatus Delongbacteria bacterium]|nr:NifB/NifX family molybdenum-iron cluster-binding protein [Candidatus Delongbacteria bacterium]
MKICMPTLGNLGLSESVHDHFGNAPYIAIYDTATRILTIVNNNHPYHQHEDCQPLSLISQYDIKAVLANTMGNRSIQILNSGGVKVYRSNGETLQEAIRQFEANQLQELISNNS